MAKAKKLPSGNWRVLVYDYTDSNGKRHYESFTAADKAEAEYQAAEFSINKKRRKIPANMTLREAIDKYISCKENLLSPATVRGYIAIKKNRFKPIMDKKIDKIENEDIQSCINEEAKTYSPKTIRNGYGLIRTILHEYCGYYPSVTLPQPIEYTANVVQPEDIPRLLKAVEGDTCEVQILLALWLGLRRSEILGLHWDQINIKRHTIEIKNALVPDKNNKLILKGTKTVKSQRVLPIPDYIYNKLIKLDKTNDFIFNTSPDLPLKHLKKACKSIGIENVRLHDLRHTMASIGGLLNISDQYLMKIGGWSNTKTLKKYEQAFNSGFTQATAAITSYLESIMQHEMQHK